MAGREPQNPIYPVDAYSVEACLSKVLCPACGTVIPVRPRRMTFTRRCPSCTVALQVSLRVDGWVAEVVEPVA